MPTISVIVPVYKVEPYLRRCVDSILAQTFTDFELILVDDGSPDNCGAICDEYAEKDARIRVIHKQNGGVSAARNTGIDASAGEFLMFCDSDDFVHPKWAETLYNCIKNEPDDFVSCLSVDFKSEEEVSGFSMTEPAETRAVTYFELFEHGQSAYIWSKIYNAEKIRGKSFRFDEELFLAEDVEFNARYCADCNRILLINSSLYYYRYTETSAARRYRPDTLTLLFQPFTSRLPLVGQENLESFCSTWFYMMYHELDNVFDKRNTEWSYFKKMRYNREAISSEEFQYCMTHANLSFENPLLIKLLRNKRYFAFHYAKKAAGIKKGFIKALGR